MKCPYCNVEMKQEKSSFKKDEIDYHYFKCPNCGEELLNMNQLKAVSSKYQKLKFARQVQISKWGNSLAIRIPKEFVEEFHLKDGKKGILYKDKQSIRIGF